MAPDIIIWVFISVLASSFVACYLVIVTQRWHGKHTLDDDLQGSQKIHFSPVPRVGGLGLAIGLGLGTTFSFVIGSAIFFLALQLLLCAVPVFAAGLLEDLTKKVSVRARLYASFISAACATYVLDAELTRLDNPLLDLLIHFGPVSLLFTCFAVGGMTNAINIIDGLNGLASGCVALMLGGLAMLAWQAGDVMVMKLSLLGVAALLGFIMLNFPFGRIFLGDGGAYLAGFWLAECAVLLLARNPGVSTWTVLLVCFYPAWETTFSIYRRHMIHGVSSGCPDSQHLHHVIYRNIAYSPRYENLPTWAHHGLATSLIWLLVAGCQVYAGFAHNSGTLSAIGLTIFMMTYLQIYRAVPLTHPNNTFEESART